MMLEYDQTLFVLSGTFSYHSRKSSSAGKVQSGDGETFSAKAFY